MVRALLMAIFFPFFAWLEINICDPNYDVIFLLFLFCTFHHTQSLAYLAITFKPQILLDKIKSFHGF